MEAMAMGKAIVSTPAGINGLDLTAGSDVLLVNTGKEMAEAIRDLFDHPEKRRALQDHARQTVERRFDWDQIAQEQKRLYQSMIR